MNDLGIEEIAGEVSRFFVSSDSGKEPYLVDLREYDGSGSCSCYQFQMRLKPKLDKGERDWTPARSLMCKHILRAWSYAGPIYIRMLDQNP